MNWFGNNLSLLLSDRGATITPFATGPVYTIAPPFTPGSQASLVAGKTHANLTLSTDGRSIVVGNAIAVGTSQVATVRETNGSLAVEYPVTITAKA